MPKQARKADGGAVATQSQNGTKNWLTPRGGRSTPGKHPVPIWMGLRAAPNEHGKPHQHKPGPSAVSKLKAFNKYDSGKRPCECRWYNSCTAVWKIFKLQKISPPRGFFGGEKMIHLLSSDLEIQTYMIKVHLACQNYQRPASWSTNHEVPGSIPGSTMGIFLVGGGSPW